MPIQFRCTSCRKPIEVDDEWANQPVGCPFCGAENVAPAESNLQWGQEDFSPPPPPEIRPAREVPTIGPASYEPVAEEVALRPNPLGKWSLILGILAWVVLIVCTGVASVRAIGDLSTSIPQLKDPSGISQQKLQELVRDYLMTRMQNKNLPGWVVLFYVGYLLAFVLAVVSVGLAIAGLTRRHVRKGTAAGGLIASGSLLTCSCCLFALGLMMRPAV